MTSATSPETSPLSDPELIIRVHAGDADAFGELFARHLAAVRRVAVRLAGHACADDLISEAFTKILMALRQGKGPEIAFRPYVFATMRRLQWRKENQSSSSQGADDFDLYRDRLAVDDCSDSGLKNAGIARVFHGLPERWQAVLWYTVAEDLSAEDVALRLGLSANAVGDLAFHAREGLRQALCADHLADPVDGRCEEVCSELPGYVRGRRFLRKRKKIAEHIDECLGCAGATADLRLINNDLQGVLLSLVLGPLASSAWLDSDTVLDSSAWFNSNPPGTFQKSRSPKLVIGAASALVLAGGATAVVVLATGPEEDSSEQTYISLPSAVPTPPEATETPSGRFSVETTEPQHTDSKGQAEFEEESDGQESKPAESEPIGEHPEPESAEPTVQPEPDAAAQEPDPVEPDAAAQEPDPVEPDAAAQEPGSVEPDTAAQEPDPVEPDAATQEPDPVEPDAGAQEPESTDSEPESAKTEPAEPEPPRSPPGQEVEPGPGFSEVKPERGRGPKPKPEPKPTPELRSEADSAATEAVPVPAEPGAAAQEPEAATSEPDSAQPEPTRSEQKAEQETEGSEAKPGHETKPEPKSEPEQEQSSESEKDSNPGSLPIPPDLTIDIRIG